MDICTIIAKNYVAQARVLARSFLNHHPQGRVWALVIDDFADYLDRSQEPFEILTPREIGCEPFEDMAIRYDVLELSTAVKPWLLRHLMSETAGPITYLDPDIQVFGSLERLDQLARDHGVVLTPHNTEPIPDDGKRPSQIDIMIAGIYNLGYISVAPSDEITGLLDWWSDRLRRDCRVDPVYGYFVDQRWFDLVPGFVTDYAVVRDPQYNVAYWNLHSRDLDHDGRGYTAGGEPLAFFHFSGFDPDEPAVLSRHQNRVDVAHSSALESILDEYAIATKMEGYAQTQNWPYTFDTLPDGTRLDQVVRKLYVDAEDTGQLSLSLFTPEGSQAFLEWLGEPAPGASRGVHRLLAHLYGTRGDLREAFPDLDGPDLGRLLRWARHEGLDEVPALGRLPLSGNAEEPDAVALPPPASEVWGVNVVGYFRSELGVGEAARQVVNALDAVGVDLLPVHGHTVPPSRQGHGFSYLDPASARFPVNLICMNADMLPELAAQTSGEGLFDDRYSIGLWFWEISTFPDRWMGSFRYLNEVWAPTRHIADTLAAVAPIPVIHMPIPVVMSSAIRRPRELLSLPNGFMFLFMFDYYSGFERKNPLAVIEAFCRAFPTPSGASLVIKLMNQDSDPKNHERLQRAAAANPDVYLLDGSLPANEKNSLIAASDCYVSLHRAEGFGLTMAEAMQLGKPVIATNYAGNCDFMDHTNSFLVRYEMVGIGPNAAPYPPDGEWADPDVEHAAELMRAVFTDQSAAAELGARASADIQSRHSPVVTGERMARRLEVVRTRRGHAGTTPVDPDPVDGLVRRLSQGPVASRDISRRSPRGLARRLTLRVMRPFTAYQDVVNKELLRAVERRTEIESAKQSDAALTVRSAAAALAGLRSQERATDVFQGAVVERLDRLQSETDALAALRGSILERLNGLDHAVKAADAQARAIPYMEGTPFEKYRLPKVGEVDGYRIGHDSGVIDEYRVFEDIFRGSEQLIADRQRVFVDLIGDRRPVLDFGCGRGEFLDLLAQREIPYVGVDSDPGMVQRCHEKGHTTVALADGLRFLDSLQDQTLGAIFCAQVIEHLTYESLLRLVALARRKLNTNGMLIAETVNPHCVSALKTFWVDLTHRHPIFPEVALALCRTAGFPTAFVFHPNGTGDVGRDRFEQGEYAIVAGAGALLEADASDHVQRTKIEDEVQ